MNLNALVFRQALKIPPKTIVDRLINLPDVMAAADFYVGRFGRFGRIRYDVARRALREVSMEVDVTVGGDESTDRVVLRRTPGGVLVRSEGSEAGQLVVELSLFDPEQSVRARALDLIAMRAKPWLPSEEHMRQLVEAGPLQVHDFHEVMCALGEVAENKLEAISQGTRKARITVHDFVPRGRTYYESLVGPMPSGQLRAAYVEDVLYPHLDRIFAKDPVWGWRCLRAAFVGRSVAVERVISNIRDDDLYEILNSVRPSSTPFGPVALLNVALPRAGRDKRYLDLAKETFSNILDRTTKSPGELGSAATFPQLMTLTLRLLSTDEETWNAPPYWRRLAAFTHAHALLDVLDFEGVNILEFGQWCQSTNSATALAAEFIDLRLEPMWRPALEYASGMWKVAAGHAIRACETERIDMSDVAAWRSFQANSGLRAVFQLWAAMPDPLEGDERISTNPDATVIEQEISQRILSDTASQGPSIRVWQQLLVYARIFKFDDRLSHAMGEWLAQYNDGANNGIGEAIEVAALAASIASVQSNENFAETTARFIIERAHRFRDQEMAGGAWGCLVIAAAAHREIGRWSDWLSEKLLALAYRLPKGEACQDLAARIEAMHSLIPLAQRRWGNVRATALCA